MSKLRRAAAISLGIAACSLCTVSPARAAAVNDQSRMEIGIWAQGWYQVVEDAAPNGGNLHDFIARRAYLSVKGEVSPYFEFFTHVATDRLGQDGLDNGRSLIG